MEPVWEIMARHGGSAQVGPADMLAALLQVLTEGHVLGAVGGFAAGATNKATFFEEVMARQGLVGKAGQVPPSLLLALDAHLDTQRWMDGENAKNAQQQDSTQAAALDRRSRALKALVLTIREIANQADTHSLQSRIALEAMAKKEGWRLNGGPPPEPPKR